MEAGHHLPDLPAVVSGSRWGWGVGDLVGQRSHHGRRLNIALNMRGGKQNLNVAGRVPLSTYLDREGERIDGQCELPPDEGVVVEVG